eukprot:1717455-Prymnesium_polylepis.1
MSPCESGGRAHAEIVTSWPIGSGRSSYACCSRLGGTKFALSTAKRAVAAAAPMRSSRIKLRTSASFVGPEERQPRAASGAARSRAARRAAISRAACQRNILHTAGF